MADRDYLNNKYITDQLDAIWCGDFTNIDKIKVFALLDLSTRLIVGHLVKQKHETLQNQEVSGQIGRLIEDVSLSRQVPIIIHTDLEPIFKAQNLKAYLDSKNINHSFADHTHNKFRNQVVERFWKTLKTNMRVKLRVRFSLTGSKANRALNYLSSLTQQESYDLINECITEYNNTAHTHNEGLSPTEMDNALLYSDKHVSDTLVIPEESPVDPEILIPELELEALLNNALARNGSLAADHMQRAKQQAAKEYTSVWYAVAMGLDKLAKGQQAIIDEITLSKEETISRLQTSLNAQHNTIIAQTSQLDELQEQITDQSGKISFLESEAKAKKQLEEEMAAKRLARKNRKRKPARDAATFPEFEISMQVIDNWEHRSPFTKSRDRAAMLIIYLTGMRIGNLRMISSSNLQELIDEKGLLVADIKTPDTKQLFYPLSPSGRELVRGYRADLLALQETKDANDRVFTAYGSKAPMQRSWLTQRVNDILKGVTEITKKKLTSHSYRIGNITALSRTSGLDIAKEQIGHSSIQTTYAYVRNTRSLAELSEIHERKEQEKRKRIPRFQKERSTKELDKKD